MLESASVRTHRVLGLELQVVARAFLSREPPPARWLAYYADTFDTVEVNNTFYRLPERTTFASIYCVWMISSERCRDRGVAGSYVM